MFIISSEFGVDDCLLCLFSVFNLFEILFECEGWVDCFWLYDFFGCNCKLQIELVWCFGLEDYVQFFGGCCFLIDEFYFCKLVDLWWVCNECCYELDDIMLLKVGWYICLQLYLKLIISCEEGENCFLEGYCYQFISFIMVSCFGLLVLVDGCFELEVELEQVVVIVVCYFKGCGDDIVIVEVKEFGGVVCEVCIVLVCFEDIFKNWLVVQFYGFFNE